MKTKNPKKSCKTCPEALYKVDGNKVYSPYCNKLQKFGYMTTVRDDCPLSK